MVISGRIRPSLLFDRPIRGSRIRCSILDIYISGSLWNDNGLECADGRMDREKVSKAADTLPWRSLLCIWGHFVLHVGK